MSKKTCKASVIVEMRFDGVLHDRVIRCVRKKHKKGAHRNINWFQWTTEKRIPRG